MNKLPILSIIIPVYNVKDYISECLDSVCNQDLDKEIYEIICVDDGSTDNSKNIIINYQEKYENIILISHESNKKLGVARNTGRSVAKGKYIWNVDSDDYIKPHILKKIIDICEANSLDVLMFNFDHKIALVENINKSYPFINSQVMTGIEFIKRYCINNFKEISPIWTQVYNRNFLEKNDIYSPPINMGEDVPFTLKALLFAEKIMSITISCYVYRSNINSLGGLIESNPNPTGIYEKCFVCARYVYDIVKYIPKKEVEITRAYLLVSKYIISLYPRYLKNLNKKDFKQVARLCRTNFFQDINIVLLLGPKKSIYYFFRVIFPIFKIK